MSVIPTISQNGVGVVAAGQLNAYQISALNTATLRSLTGQTGMTAFLLGTYVPNDGGQGVFWWNYASVAPDDNSTVIVPYGATSGAWNRLSFFITPNLPTTLPATAGVFWNNGGVVCIS